MVADAGPASASISAATDATVTIKTMRFLGATSLRMWQPVAPLAHHALLVPTFTEAWI
jgi:hypothetical protein